ncbi:hypothetical protein BQ9231_00369 [Cedratvirus lausannensis]|uniref:Uncharacterized protein n=1 Tax=Cedratvirus lausannensis TaxID=2023205 RepID=A0A285PYH0_9VIRU|nr:hypothetical protein BQ9231_00369 [Cedratvirus lausannensis]
MENKPITLSSFWREKFRTDNLPLLEEGEDFYHWSELYDRSVQAGQVAHEKINSGRTIQIALSKVDNLDLLKVTHLDQDTWESIQENNLDNYLSMMQEEKTIIHDYYLLLSPRAEFYLYEKIDKREEINNQDIRKQILFLPSTKIALSKDDAWFFVYRLAYHGYPF